MLTSLLHRLVAQPKVYDLVQTAVGASHIRSRLTRHLAALGDVSTVLDIGGGPGTSKSLWSDKTRYICLDIDPLKLSGYRAKNPASMAILGDATNLPIKDRSIDLVTFTSLTHHLTDDMLELLLRQTLRVLKPGGHFVLMDPLWAPYRLPGRLLWRYDRGSFPRTAEHLRRAIEPHFAITVWDQFAILHRYVIAMGKARA
jgi:ubiquinone/menaquinone biosynthesis C-methylase UbiE